jgi:glucokinase
MRILAADVGGTKSELCLYTGPSVDALNVERRERYDSREHAGLLPIVGDFLRGEAVDAAAFGIAGPVQGGVCHATNLPWVVSADELRVLLSTPKVVLLNDVQIAAHGLAALAPTDLYWLQRGEFDETAPAELVAVGTGLGRAIRVPGAHVPLPTEYGHVGFAPRNVIERRLLAYVAERHESVCLEHLISGPALRMLFDFVILEGLASTTSQLEIDCAEDPSAAIGRLGLLDQDEACAAAVALFADILGSALGNVALSTLPRGGLYLWGGVARRLGGVLKRGDLLDAFRDKPPMEAVMRTIPLALVEEPDLALLGACRAAAHAISQ